MKKKKYDPLKVRLDAFEQGIEDAINPKNIKRPTKSQINKIRKMANNTLKEMKTERANIRMSKSEIKSIQAMAEAQGLPYQTFITHIMKKYIARQLVDIEELKKVLDFKVCSSRKII